MAHDPLVSALVALCKREGDYKLVADRAAVSADNLWQIISGTKLPSGNPRGVGPKLRARLTIAYPDWLEPAPSRKSSTTRDILINDIISLLERFDDPDDLRRAYVRCVAAIEALRIELQPQALPPQSRRDRQQMGEPEEMSIEQAAPHSTSHHSQIAASRAAIDKPKALLAPSKRPLTKDEAKVWKKHVKTSAWADDIDEMAAQHANAKPIKNNQ